MQHGPVGNSIVARLQAALSPTELILENESYKHSVPANSETHFKLFVVSESFDGMMPVARHRLVHESLGDLLEKGVGAGGVHALSIKAKTPKQVAKALAASGDGATSASLVQETPSCKGGSKADRA
jgi:BolA protein